jgi:pheromone shutdown-related protein TraB
MLKSGNLTLVGTSHVAIDSVREVERVILDLKPDIVALELDLPRFTALLSPQKRKLSVWDMRKLGVKGFLFNLIGAWAEKKIGDVVGVSPGSEMLKAAHVASQIGADIALIDQDIAVTMNRLSKAITWREKFRFFWELVKGFFVRKPLVNFDLRKVPSKDVIKILTDKVRKDYPSVYRILIAERNVYMSKNLYNLLTLNKKIVAVVGAGHEEEIISLIGSYDKRQNARLIIVKQEKNG